MNIVKNQITVLFPGSFKPMTRAHVALIKRYEDNPNVKEIKVFIGPGIRNGITQEISKKIADKLLINLKKVTIEIDNNPSPILSAYKYIENASPGTYTIASSTKDNDYNRVKEFIKKHQPGEKYRTPIGVNVIEFPMNVKPILFSKRNDEYNKKPISASILRKDVLNGDFDNFICGYNRYLSWIPKYVIDIWELLMNNIKPDIQIVPSINKHMTHIEDLVITGKAEELKWVNNILLDIYRSNLNNISLSTKYDGSPAIWAWSNFNNLPPGIAMKGLFYKNSKIFYTSKEIDDYFDDKLLVYKLQTLLENLPYINIPEGTIWQGDFLFDNKSIEKDIINNKECFIFHQNTIVYAIPVKSKLGKKISKANMGIVWHTKYVGTNLKNIRAIYNVDSSILKTSKYVFNINPLIKSYKIEKNQNIEEKLQEIKKLSKKYTRINKDLADLFMIYQNFAIREKEELNVDNFIKFLKNKFNKEAEKKKSKKGKQDSYNKCQFFIDNIDKNIFTNKISLINEITYVKKYFIKELNKNEKEIQTYLKLKDGTLKSTNHEGYVVSDMSNNVVKLIDREEFSYSNFSPEFVKSWKK